MKVSYLNGNNTILMETKMYHNQEIIKCKYCKYYNKKSREDTVSLNFIEIIYDIVIDDNKITPPSGITKSEIGYIKMCNHPKCFQYNIIFDPINGNKEVRKRIMGQAQLNKNGNCKYFKPKWWYRIKLKLQEIFN